MKARSAPSSCLLPEQRGFIGEVMKGTGGDGPHMAHVTRLALQFFDQLRTLHKEGLRSRALLEAAALLHDIGFSISESAHHKHSRDLILRNPVPGFTGEEMRAVACLARYHRRAGPSKRHPLFAELSAPARRTVRRLAALLRVADGLDRSHRSAVQALRCEIGKSQVTVVLVTSADLAVDVEGAERKKDCFESLFARSLIFQVEKCAQPPSRT